MLLVRSFDTKAVALQRTGKLGTYASCLGHEATHIGIGSAMQLDDVLAPSYREYGAQFYRGVRPRDVLMYWGGDERGNDFTGPKHDLPWCVPISTQCLHAAGAAMAFKIRHEARVAMSVCGDGGTSKSDFYGAVNMAGAWKLPLLLVVVNNQYAISVPRRLQSGAETLAQKAIAGGIRGVQVDGNDLLAVRSVADEAVARALAGEGATLIECVTYRLGDHTTADDARRYRDDEEVRKAWEEEPLKRLRAYLYAQQLWDEAREAQWLAESARRIDIEINAYLESTPQPVSAMFDFLYAELPHDVAGQRAQVMAEEQG